MAAVAGLKTMEILRRDGTYEHLRNLGSELQKMQSEALTKAGVAHRICGDETLFDILFRDAECLDYRSAKHKDPKQNSRYNDTLRKHGIFKSPGKTYPCLALSDEDLLHTEETIVVSLTGEQ